MVQIGLRLQKRVPQTVGGSLALLLVLNLNSACSTFRGGPTTEETLYKVQKRLLDLERKVNEDVLGKQQREGAKRLAQGEERLEQLGTDIDMIRGEIDALRIGVTVGEMPGTPQDQESIAKNVQELSARVQAIEARQIEILELVDKAKAKTLAKGKEPSLKSLAQVRKSFDDKKYQAIVNSAEIILAEGKLKPEEKSELKYLYAQSLFEVGKFRDAAIEYNQLLMVTGMESHIPHIKLRLGDCFRKLGDAKAALIFYRELLRDFPKSKEADQAKAQVDKMGG